MSETVRRKTERECLRVAIKTLTCNNCRHCLRAVSCRFNESVTCLFDFYLLLTSHIEYYVYANLRWYENKSYALKHIKCLPRTTRSCRLKLDVSSRVLSNSVQTFTELTSLKGMDSPEISRTIRAKTGEFISNNHYVFVSLSLRIWYSWHFFEIISWLYCWWFHYAPVSKSGNFPWWLILFWFLRVH